MLSTNKELRQIFLSQTEELLRKLETQGLLAGTDTHYDDRLSVTDLVLHTIKGDAGAVGLADVSSAAKLCLALVRSKGKAGCEVWRRAGGNELLVEFVKAVRGCLGQVQASGKGGEENFVLLGRLLRYAMSEESSEPMAVGSEAGPAGSGRASSIEEVPDIVAAAPPVKPRIQEIIALARSQIGKSRVKDGSRTEGDAAGFTVQAVPTVERVEKTERCAPCADRADPRPLESTAAAPGFTSIAAAVQVKPRVRKKSTPGTRQEKEPTTAKLLPGGAALRGICFELSCAQACIGSLLHDEHLSPEARPTLELVSDLLLGSEPACSGCDSVTLREAFSPSHGTSHETPWSASAVEVDDPDFALDPAFAALLRKILTEICEKVLGPGGGGTEILRLKVSRDSGRGLHIVLGGLGQAIQQTTPLSLFSQRVRIGALGGQLRVDRERSEIVTTLGDSFRSVEVLSARKNDIKLGFLAHRVVDILEGDEARDALSCDLDGDDGPPSFEYRGKKVKWIQLSGPRESREEERSASTVIITSAGSGFLAVEVDKVLGKQEMLVQLTSHCGGQSEILGLCIEENGESPFPLVSAAMLGKMLE